MYPAPDLLILDEVSTHLDLDTISALIRALRYFSGAVFLVSHDRHLMKCVVEGAPALPPSADSDDGRDDDSESESEGDTEKGTVYMVGMKGNTRPLSGGTDEYVEIIERRMRKQGLI